MEEELMLHFTDKYDKVNRVITYTNGKSILEIKKSKVVEVFRLNLNASEKIKMEKLQKEYAEHRVWFQRGELPKNR